MGYCHKQDIIFPLNSTVTMTIVTEYIDCVVEDSDSYSILVYDSDFDGLIYIVVIVMVCEVYIMCLYL